MIGDVCGKGAEAAALTALVRYTLRAIATAGQAPERGAARAERRDPAPALGRPLLHGRATRAWRTTEHRRARGARERRPPAPARGPRRRRGRARRRSPARCSAWCPTRPCTTSRSTSRPGDTLVLYTDGVTEAGAPEQLLEPDELADAIVAGCAGAERPRWRSASSAPPSTPSDGDPHDDIAIVVARVSADVATAASPSEPLGAPRAPHSRRSRHAAAARLPAMQINELRENRLRELARMRPDGARVLSVFLNLDPSEFAQPPARATEIASVIDDAERRMREANDSLSHDEARRFARTSSARASSCATSRRRARTGWRCSRAAPADLFEAIRLPRPIETRAVIDDSPFVEPLVELASAGQLAGAAGEPPGRADAARLARAARGAGGRRGRGARPPPAGRLVAGALPAQRRRGRAGPPQASRRRGLPALPAPPFDHAAARRPGARRSPTSRASCTRTCSERLAGRVEVDVENTTPTQVRDAARAEDARSSTASASARRSTACRRASRSGGRGAAGLDDVLGALNERRVEMLLLPRASTPPAALPAVRLGRYSQNGGKCPADGTELDCRDDVIESAVELALEQSRGGAACARRGAPQRAASRTAASPRCCASRRPAFPASPSRPSGPLAEVFPCRSGTSAGASCAGCARQPSWPPRPVSVSSRDRLHRTCCPGRSPPRGDAREQHEDRGNDADDRRQAESHADRLDECREQHGDQYSDHVGLLPLVSFPKGAASCRAHHSCSQPRRLLLTIRVGPLASQFPGRVR